MNRLYLVSLSGARGSHVQAEAGLYSAVSAEEAAGLAITQFAQRHPAYAQGLSVPTVTDMTDEVRSWVAGNPTSGA